MTILIGREPLGEFEVVVRRDDGSPVVLSNQPLLSTGRPMPTRFWLADRTLTRVIGQLESTGAVTRAENEIPPQAIAATHAAAERERDALIPADHVGPRPSGGVAGTRMGVKCLHAHYASFLAGADDVVGRWVQDCLTATDQAFDSAESGIVTEQRQLQAAEQAGRNITEHESR